MPPSPVAPAWAVFPLAFIAMIAVAAYILALRDARQLPEMPASRRRIRLASAWTTLLTIPVLAVGFAVVTPATPRWFLLIWVAGVGLLGIIVMLSAIDLADSARIQRAERRALLRELTDARRSLLGSPKRHEDWSRSTSTPGDGGDDARV